MTSQAFGGRHERRGRMAGALAGLVIALLVAAVFAVTGARPAGARAAAPAAGQASAWGFDGAGQLGEDTVNSRGTLARVSGLTDIAAVAGGYYHSLVVKPDTTPPTVALTAPADGSTAGGRTTLSADASDDVGVTRVEFLVNGYVVASDATSPYVADWDSDTIADGTITIAVRAYDAAGNQTTSAARRVTVDNTAPAKPFIASPADNSYDNDGDFSVKGTAEANSSVELFEGTTSLGTAAVDPSGSWSVDLAGVPEGTHSYTARATDPAGNTSDASSAVTVTVDETATTAPTIDGPASVYDNHGSFTVSGTAEKGDTVELFEGSTSKGKATADASSGNWSIDLTRVSEGTHTYTAKATDPAGDASGTSGTVTVTVDETAPGVGSTTPTDGAKNVLRATTITAIFSEAMDPSTLKGSTVTLINAKTGAAVTAKVALSPDGKTATLNPSSTLEKKSQYEAKISGAKDLAGNALADKTWSFTTGKK